MEKAKRFIVICDLNHNFQIDRILAYIGLINGGFHLNHQVVVITHEGIFFSHDNRNKLINEYRNYCEVLDIENNMQLFLRLAKEIKTKM